MTPQDALVELLARVGASGGAEVYLTTEDLNRWPSVAVQAMQVARLLSNARPAESVVCPGCERECAMPVHVTAAEDRVPAIFVVCDKREDINRVPIPRESVEQWQASGDAVADLLASLLELRRPDRGVGQAGRWNVGLLKGAKHSAHLVLVAGNELVLAVAGHSIALVDVLELAGCDFMVDRKALIHRVHRPVAGGGDEESAAQRRARLRKRVSSLRSKGAKAFLKTVAEEENISIPRLKQLLAEEPPPPTSRTRR
jgi:hypothetical protein